MATLLLSNVKIKKSDEKKFEKDLKNWSILQPKLNDFTEAELLGAMLYERQTKNRLNILQRLYGRYSKIRGERERREVLYGDVNTAVPADKSEA